MSRRATVLGSGSFGTALAQTVSSNFEEVLLWGRDAEHAHRINAEHRNDAYLKDVPLSERLRAVTSLPEALEDTELVVVAIPSHATREVMGEASAFIPRQVPIVTVAKGIENETLLTMTEVLESVLPAELHPYLAVLSGPSFARELALGMPTVVTIASHWARVGASCQRMLQTEAFRTYTSPDVVGVQIGGALKNVIAIAAGMADGLGFGHNARSALITRGLAEITRMAVRLGANPLTLSGLSGMGDLVLTCTGDLSRNRTVGFELGRGRKLEEILSGMNQVAEGVKTARSTRDLAARSGVEMPIAEQVYAICYEGKDPRRAVVELMTRAPKAEQV